MYLTFNVNNYELQNFTFAISKTDDKLQFQQNVDCALADSVDLEELAEEIENSFQGNFTINVDANSSYDFIEYEFSDLRLYVDNTAVAKNILFTKVG